MEDQISAVEVFLSRSAGAAAEVLASVKKYSESFVNVMSSLADFTKQKAGKGDGGGGGSRSLADFTSNANTDPEEILDKLREQLASRGGI